VEKTLVIVKPDGVQRGLVGEIINRLERRGLKILALKMTVIDEATARKHYGVHEGKHFFEGLVKYITSGPVVLMVLEGKQAIEAVRTTMGATNPSKAAPGTIRGDLAVEMSYNLIHGSDAPESAVHEIEIFFPGEDLVSWKRSDDKWISE
jgi:nucleoside-diphosphate kinase